MRIAIFSMFLLACAACGGGQGQPNLSEADQARLAYLEKELAEAEATVTYFEENDPDQLHIFVKRLKQRQASLDEFKANVGFSKKEQINERVKPKKTKRKTQKAKLPASKIKGVTYVWGEKKRVYSRSMGMHLNEYQGGGVYLILKNGTAIRHPNAPPSDFDLKAFKRDHPKRIGKLKDLMIAKSSIYPPRKRGYTLDIYVSRPSTSSTFTSTRSTWRSLKLTKEGRFETGRTSLTSTNYNGGSDTTYGAGGTGSYASSSGKKGTFTAGSSNFSVGGGSAMVREGSGTAGEHTGTYLIDGNTIELRYDNGKVVRSIFGTDGEENVIFGSTNYWTPK